jgi:cytochrome c-type biogenesis protein CcmH/NrfG
VLAEQSEALLQVGRAEEAAAMARRALRMQSDLLLPRSVLASVAERQGRWTEARDHLAAILGRLPAGDPRLASVRASLDRAERKLRESGGP